jgi:hypothetical protein
MKLKMLAGNNLSALRKNHYPGRGIIVGLDETGDNLVQVYWIMGRSENSRNRLFTCEPGGILKTIPANHKKVVNPNLIIYTAMAELPSMFAVSNGSQTKSALNYGGLGEALKEWEYEDDPPNYTPRITALFKLNRKNPYITEISILKKSPFNGICDRYLYNLEVSHPGLGYCVSTYVGDGDPLPSFKGDPYLLPLLGDIDKVLQGIWSVLNEENRISLAVKFINIKSRESDIRRINKYEKVC